jgi:hypothetical protein
LYSVAVQADEEVKKKFKEDVEKLGKECFEIHPIKDGKNYILTPNTLYCPKKGQRIWICRDQQLETAFYCSILDPSSSRLPSRKKADWIGLINSEQGTV